MANYMESTVLRSTYNIWWTLGDPILKSVPLTYTTNAGYDSATTGPGVIIESSASKTGWEPATVTVTTVSGATIC